MTQVADEVGGFGPVADPQAALAWIPQDVREDGVTCGMDASGWEDDTWVLHDLTVPIDLADREEGPRVRRRWHDVTDEDLAAVSKARGWPPNAMYLIRKLHWPDVEVEEGVFDGESQTALLDIVSEFSGPDVACFAYYGMVPANEYERLTVLEGTLSAIGSLTRNEDLFRGLSPSNWWPSDRSWFVWTDYDLTATRVSGSRALIEAVRSDSRLETLDWRCPGGSRSAAERLRERG
ncbi:hypothetical protein [Promicromonospora kroppenstedtii]|uniref:hypothetical protein n=1 Tax=Promicromonospora kroppenstedtii TaxID=440482 RepID=UPI000687EC4C|nr:hypothetical protein [Promicromonospora kroppenstedtii]